MPPSIDRARAIIRERLTDEAASHSERVGETAAQLASAYHADVELARVAGLLHDWCKDCDGAWLVQEAERLGLPVTEVDRAVPYLLHATVGAAEVRAAFPELDARAIDAIASHTCGADSMSDLDMVVYIADAIEAGRTHDGVEALRAAVGVVPLRELFARTYMASFWHLLKTRKHIHPVTVTVWNALVAKESR